MQYRNRSPVTKRQRSQRRARQRSSENKALEQNRQRSKRGGQPNELGIVQGQNGEQGNTFDPRQAKHIGRTSH